MSTAFKLISFLLLAVACVPPGASTSVDSTETGDPSTSDSSASESNTSNMDSAESGTAFVGMSDIPLVPSCDPFMQNCPEGEKCVPYASAGGNFDANKCVPVLGEQALGEPCTYDGKLEATDTCDESGICWNVTDVDGEMVGTCHAFCQGTADTPECPEGTACDVHDDGSLAICISTCDPIAQDCGEGVACYWTDSNFLCIFTTMNLPTGEPCGYVNDCAAGNVCVAAELFPTCAGSACCGLWCDLGLGDAPCAVLPGTSCVAFFEENMARPGNEHIGVCILPP